jgi:hypothetical protein
MAGFVALSLRCPLCDLAFVTEIPEPDRLAAFETDFRPRFEGRDPLAQLIHACPSCRYTAYPDGFVRGEVEPDDEPDDLELAIPRALGFPALPPPCAGLPEDDDLPELRRWAQGGELQKGVGTSGREPFGAERYVLGARCYEHLRGDEPRGASDYWLRASWCARAAGGDHRDLEKRCQERALERILVALEAQGAIGDGERPRFVYLAGELARRAQDFARGLDLFGRIPELCDPDEDEGAFLLRLARRQSRLAMVQSDAIGDMPEPVPEPDEPDPVSGEEEG